MKTENYIEWSSVLEASILGAIVGALAALIGWMIGLSYTDTFVAPFALGLQDVRDIDWTPAMSALVWNYLMANPNWYAILIPFFGMVGIGFLCGIVNNRYSRMI
jgi:ABC-type antimicrobial peptide transport system permease subunit